MAVDKLVDSTQLDAGLTSVANAIRTKGGTSADLAFPAGFVSAVNAIPTGGSPTGTKQISITENGTTTYDVTNYASAEITVNVSSGGETSVEDGILSGSLSGVYTNNNVDTLRDQALANCKSVTGIVMLNVTNAGSNAFYNCDHVTNISLPSLRSTGVYALASMRALTAIALPALTNLNSFLMTGDTALVSADFGPDAYSLGGRAFASCSALRTVVLRYSNAIVTCAANTFDGASFASGGAGGTIYIPKVLYDHLGDGTALDYKAATNWSVYDAYGTITWAQIEGSIYETQYADGTPVT